MKLRMQSILVVASIIIVGSLASGCFFRELKREVAEYDAIFALVGRVINPSGRQGQVLVVLFSEENGHRVPVRYMFPDDSGNFSFMVDRGAYFLEAFEDINENLKHDPGEYAGYYGSPDKILTPETYPTDKKSAIKGLDIRLTPTEVFRDGLDVTEHLDIEQMPVFKAGVIRQLEDSLFDPANGSIGYWKPVTFIKQFGVGIYFLEPYDPQRIPVVFVHGAVGTPRGWQKMVSHLDKSLYQAWFYYYPSGIRLGASANALSGLLKALHDKHRFNRLYIIGHSMGGLVSRAAILNSRYQLSQNYVKLFVSLSTPWGGIRMAKAGVEQSPGVIPSWYDVTPNSQFLEDIYSRALSPEIPFYLFFGYKGNYSLFMDNNDGTIELKSELDYRAQSDAAGIYGFDENHDSILESQAMLERWQMVLKQATKE